MGAQKADSVRVRGHDVPITSPAKILFPEDGNTKGVTTKGSASGCYLISEGRPLTIERFPDGILEAGFFHDHPAILSCLDPDPRS